MWKMTQRIMGNKNSLGGVTSRRERAKACNPIFQDVFTTKLLIYRQMQWSRQLQEAESTVRFKQAKAKCSIIYSNPITLLILLRLNATDISYT